MLVATLAEHIPHLSDCDVIGIDRGAYLAICEGLSLRCAIGDFDSVSAEELACIKAHCPIEKLPTHKDETDSEKGILYAQAQGYQTIILYGGLGGRMDHTLANLYLVMHRDWNVILMDDHHIICKLKKGTYEIPKRFTYLSFLALEPTTITECGVAYPLQKRKITPYDIYTISNEISDSHATITIHEGSVLMIQCEDTAFHDPISRNNIRNNNI